MSGSAFAVTHYAFSSGAGRTSDGNGSHASTLKSPSYTKSVSWQHYQKIVIFINQPFIHIKSVNKIDHLLGIEIHLTESILTHKIIELVIFIRVMTPTY
nr:hypothetical protein [Escherichia coli]